MPSSEPRSEPSSEPRSEPRSQPGAETGSGQAANQGASQPPALGSQSSPQPAPPGLELGKAVQLLQRPSYLKTADPMPMLRPPDLVDLGEVGEVVALRPLGTVAVRFRRGTFLIDGALLRLQGEGEAG